MTAQIISPVTPNTPATTNDVKTFAKGSLIAFIGKLLGRGMQALLQIVLARALGPQMLGLYTLGWTTIRLGSVFIPLGLDRGIIHFTSKDWYENPQRFKRVLRNALTLALISGCITGASLYLAAPYLAYLLQNPDLIYVLRGFAFTFPFLAGMKIMVAATTVSQRMQYAVYTEDFGFPFLNLLFFLVFFAFGVKLFGAILATILSLTAVCFLAGYYLWQLLPPTFPVTESVVKVPVRTLLAFSTPSALAGVLNVLMLWLDRYFIGYFLSTEQTGIYQALTQIPLLFVVSLQAISGIFAPMIADLFAKREQERLNELFKVSTKWAVYWSLPVYIVVILFPNHILNVFFGSQYSGWGVSLTILATGQMLNVVTGPVGYLLIMSGYQTYWLRLCAIALVANITLNYWLIPIYGFSGAAVASMCSIVILNGGAVLEAYRLLHLWPYDWRYMKGVVAATGTALTLLFYHFEVASWPLGIALLGAFILSIALFIGILACLGFNIEDRLFVSMLQRRLQKNHHAA